MVGDMVWLENKRRRKGENPKLQPKFVGPYEVIEAWGGHTYRIERQGQQSIQHESRLKPFRACIESKGQAPATLEPARRPNMKGAAPRKRIRETEPVLEPALILAPDSAVPAPEPPPTEERELGGAENATAETSTRDEQGEPMVNTPVTTTGPSGRPQRTRQPPQWYGEVYCHEILQQKPTTSKEHSKENAKNSTEQEKVAEKCTLGTRVKVTYPLSEKAVISNSNSDSDWPGLC